MVLFACYRNEQATKQRDMLPAEAAAQEVALHRENELKRRGAKCVAGTDTASKFALVKQVVLFR